MGTHHGKNGVAKFGANAISEIQDWTVEENADIAEDTAMGDAAKTFIAGVNSWSATFSCSWDELDPAQQAMTIGAAGTLALYPEGTAATATYKSGAVIIEKVGIAVNRNGIVSRTFTARGNGALVEAVVA